MHYGAPTYGSAKSTKEWFIAQNSKSWPGVTNCLAVAVVVAQRWSNKSKANLCMHSLVINLPMATVDNYSRTSLCGHSLNTSDTKESPCIFSKLNLLNTDTRWSKINMFTAGNCHSKQKRKISMFMAGNCRSKKKWKERKKPVIKTTVSRKKSQVSFLNGSSRPWT